jgi:hypothetical protein
LIKTAALLVAPVGMSVLKMFFSAKTMKINQGMSGHWLAIPSFAIIVTYV